MKTSREWAQTFRYECECDEQRCRHRIAVEEIVRSARAEAVDQERAACARVAKAWKWRGPRHEESAGKSGWVVADRIEAEIIARGLGPT